MCAAGFHHFHCSVISRAIAYYSAVQFFAIMRTASLNLLELVFRCTYSSISHRVDM